MSNATQPHVNRPAKSRFLERWAYWIIGCVVLVGFVNAKWPGAINYLHEISTDNIHRSIYPTKIVEIEIPKRVHVDKDKLEFTSPELRKVFYDYDKMAISQQKGKRLEYFTSKVLYREDVSTTYLATFENRVNKYPVSISLKFNDISKSYSTITLQKTGNSVRAVVQILEEQTQPIYRFYDDDQHYNAITSAPGAIAEFDGVATCKASNYSDYRYSFSYNIPYPISNDKGLNLYDKPEAFLIDRVAEFDQLESVAISLFDQGELFAKDGYEPYMGGPPDSVPYSLLEPEQEQELFQQVINQLDIRREFYKSHYLEMHALLREIFPDKATLFDIKCPLKVTFLRLFPR